MLLDWRGTGNPLIHTSLHLWSNQTRHCALLADIEFFFLLLNFRMVYVFRFWLLTMDVVYFSWLARDQSFKNNFERTHTKRPRLHCDTTTTNTQVQYNKLQQDKWHWTFKHVVICRFYEVSHFKSSLHDKKKKGVGTPGLNTRVTIFLCLSVWLYDDPLKLEKDCCMRIL